MTKQSPLMLKVYHRKELLSISEKKLTPKERYDKEKTKMYTFKVVKTTEADIIAKLDSVPNKAGYIKECIRKDLAENK